MGAGLLVCVFLLTYTIIKCGVPKYGPYALQETTGVPHSEPLIPGNFNFNGKTYRNLVQSLQLKDIDQNIGIVRVFGGDIWPNTSAYKLKGVDIDRAIAVRFDQYYGDVSYFLSFNTEYWKERLPEIIIYSLLILTIPASMFIIYRTNYNENV